MRFPFSALVMSPLVASFIRRCSFNRGFVRSFSEFRDIANDLSKDHKGFKNTVYVAFDWFQNPTVAYAEKMSWFERVLHSNTKKGKRLRKKVVQTYIHSLRGRTVEALAERARMEKLRLSRSKNKKPMTRA